MQLTSFGVCPGIFHKQPTSRSSEQRRTFSSSLVSHQWWLFGRQEWFILHMPLSLDSCPTRLSPIFQHLKNREGERSLLLVNILSNLYSSLDNFQRAKLMDYLPDVTAADITR